MRHAEQTAEMVGVCSGPSHTWAKIRCRFDSCSATMSYNYNNKPDMATALEEAQHDGKDMDLDLGLEYDIWY